MFWKKKPGQGNSSAGIKRNEDYQESGDPRSQGTENPIARAGSAVARFAGSGSRFAKRASTRQLAVGALTGAVLLSGGAVHGLAATTSAYSAPVTGGTHVESTVTMDRNSPFVLAEFTSPSPASSNSQSASTADWQSSWAKTTHQATLWSQSGDPANQVATVPANSTLQPFGQPDNNRLMVLADDGQSGGKQVAGWINLSDVQPITPPAGAQSSSQSSAQTPEQFIASVVPAAQSSQRETKVPAAVTIAQAILESQWGRSTLSAQAQNYFGIKADSGPGTAGVYNIATAEVYSGHRVMVNANFRAYHNVSESVMDHGRYLADNPRYAPAFQTSDPQQFATRLAAAGYATDPGYGSKVGGLIGTYSLAQYDVA